MTKYLTGKLQTPPSVNSLIKSGYTVILHL